MNYRFSTDKKYITFTIKNIPELSTNVSIFYNIFLNDATRPVVCPKILMKGGGLYECECDFSLYGTLINGYSSSVNENNIIFYYLFIPQTIENSQCLSKTNLVLTINTNQSSTQGFQGFQFTVDWGNFSYLSIQNQSLNETIPVKITTKIKDYYSNPITYTIDINTTINYEIQSNGKLKELQN